MHTSKQTRVMISLLACLAILAACATAPKGVYPTPTAAVQAMSDLIGKQDDKAIEDVFGPGSADMFHSGDDDNDAEDAARVKGWIDEKVGFEEFDENTLIALLGNDEWPWPIPLVKDGDGWRFNTEEGRQELLNRRIGRNELWTLSVMHELVDAQREYHAVARDGNPQAFAQRFISTEGKQDGLYWPTAEGEVPSPLGDLAAESEGTHENAEPFHGYFYRILTRQGAGAAGGAHEYLDGQGLLTRGFAVIAWPAKHGNSGVMTFITNHRGMVWQKDLGAETEALVGNINSYDPDMSWSPTGDFMFESDTD